MLIYFCGEDDVTRLIAKRLVRHCLDLKQIGDYKLEDANPRDSGTKALVGLPKIVQLGERAPVVGVYDSDNDCVVSVLQKYVPHGWKSKYCVINFAIDEAESWLISDRLGFSRHFKIDVDRIPQRDDNKSEIIVPYKTSQYILNEIIPHSSFGRIKELLYCEKPNQKPPRYNMVWPKYVNETWNIERAIENSQSLNRAICRVNDLIDRL